MVVLSIIVIILIIVLLVRKFTPQPQNINTDIQDIPDNNQDDFLNSFYKKEYLLTQTELKFYNILKQITDKLGLNLFCQVAMYELVNCKNIRYFNSIKSKSIDFVITEKNCKIKCCIELDDYTHKYNSRKKGDNVKNRIFQKLNINFLRIKVQNYYDIDQLEELIKKNVQ